MFNKDFYPTKENNKLIAKFMGYKLARCNSGLAWDIGKSIPSKDHLFPIQGVLHTGNELKFHESWDWLMPVVTKIIKMKENYLFDMSITHGGNCSLRVRPDYDSSSRGYDILVCEQNKGIETVYKTVVEFVKWYKKSK